MLRMPEPSSPWLTVAPRLTAFIPAASIPIPNVYTRFLFQLKQSTMASLLRKTSQIRRSHWQSACSFAQLRPRQIIAQLMASRRTKCHASASSLKIFLQSEQRRHSRRTTFTERTLWKTTFPQNVLRIIKANPLKVSPVSDVVAIAWDLPWSTFWLRKGQKNRNSCHLTCSAPQRLYECSAI